MTFTDQLKKASSNSSKILILADININTFETNKTNYLCNIDFKKLYQDMIIENKLTIHNDLLAFLRTSGS